MHVKFNISTLILTAILPIVFTQNCLHCATVYDPELEDGIPVLSARSTNLAPTIQWNYNDFGDIQRKPQNSEPPRAETGILQRRYSTKDFDDEDEEDDRDEYAKSGSQHQDQYADHPYSESQVAAKDGEDIESFFDKHLGPPDVNDQAASNQRESTDSENQLQTAPVSAPETKSSPDDDDEDFAASSPLATIISSIFHRRPLIITTTDDPNSPFPISLSTGNSSDIAALTDSAGSGSKTSSVQATPNSLAAGGGVLSGATPIAYITPFGTTLATDSSQESIASQQPYAIAQNSDGDSGGYREIYITRRPLGALLGHQNLYSSSASSYRQSMVPMRVATESAYGSGEEDQGDYARYPVAASYAYQREKQPAPAEDDTITFGLSFGRRPDSADEESSTSGGEDETAAPETPSTFAHYTPTNVMQQPSSSKSYNSFNRYQTAAVPIGYVRAMPASPQQMQQQYQQGAYAGARYHKDPSESSSAAQPVNYVPYSSPNTGATQDWAERQRLLSMLDKQIKMNPQYSNQQQNQQKGAATKVSPTIAEKFDGTLLSADHFEEKYRAAMSSRNGPKVAPVKQSRQPNNSSQVAKSYNSGRVQIIDDKIDPTLGIPQSHKELMIKGDLLRNGASVGTRTVRPDGGLAKSRVRRDDSDDKDADDGDDDGVWVDDNDDDDRQQSSDVNETSQDPSEDEQDSQTSSVATRPINVVAGPHGYELSPDDLIVYQG